MRSTLLICLFALAAGRLAAAPFIRITPGAANLAPGSVLDVTIEASTDGGQVLGGAADIAFDPAVFEVVGGAAGITKDEGSPFDLSPPPMIFGPRIAVSFLHADFSRIGYAGKIAHFQLRVLAGSANGALALDPGTSRFGGPALAGTEIFSASYTIGDLTPVDIRDYLLGIAAAVPPDQNSDGVIDVADLLTAL